MCAGCVPEPKADLDVVGSAPSRCDGRGPAGRGRRCRAASAATGNVHRLATPGTAPRRVVASPEYIQYAGDAPPCDAPAPDAARFPANLSGHSTRTRRCGRGPGTLLPIDRIAADQPFFSGKCKKRGMDVQVVADRSGRLLWALCALPGAVRHPSSWRDRHHRCSRRGRHLMLGRQGVPRSRRHGPCPCWGRWDTLSTGQQWADPHEKGPLLTGPLVGHMACVPATTATAQWMSDPSACMERFCRSPRTV